MPLFCLLVLIVHFLYSAFFSKRSMCGSFQLAQLGRTASWLFRTCMLSHDSRLILSLFWKMWTTLYLFLSDENSLDAMPPEILLDSFASPAGL